MVTINDVAARMCGLTVFSIWSMANGKKILLPSLIVTILYKTSIKTFKESKMSV